MEPDGMVTLISLLAVPAAAGAAYGGVRVGLNGARQSITQIEKIVSRLDEKVDAHSERLIAVEIEQRILMENRNGKE
jgi:hypothetical protein|tara:strand:- start:317 stop:547 length:231 start_codon:yes stop_codon:yes gene_type:complete